MKEIREKNEAMHRKRDNTISRGEAAVQKIMKEVRLLPSLRSARKFRKPLQRLILVLE